MKIGQKYLCKEGFAAAHFSAHQDEIITITASIINDCEGLINAGILVEIEPVPEGELPLAIETDPTIDLDDGGKFVRQKKSFPRRRMKG